MNDDLDYDEDYEEDCEDYELEDEQLFDDEECYEYESNETKELDFDRRY